MDAALNSHKNKLKLAWETREPALHHNCSLFFLNCIVMLRSTEMTSHENQNQHSLVGMTWPSLGTYWRKLCTFPHSLASELPSKPSLKPWQAAEQVRFLLWPSLDARSDCEQTAKLPGKGKGDSASSAGCVGFRLQAGYISAGRMRYWCQGKQNKDQTQTAPLAN